MTGEIILPSPHPGMQLVLDEAVRHNWLAAGRRWRKTTMDMGLAVETLLDGKVCFWGAPTFDQVRIGWNELSKAAGNVFQFHVSRMEVEYSRTRGKIIFRSLDDPDNARSHTADRVIMDEAAYIHPKAWSDVIRPMLMDTGGDSFANSTPNGRNWFFYEFNNAYDREDSMCWQIPTVGCEIVEDQLIRKPHSYENPDIPWSEIVNLFETQPRRTFQQEVLATFLEGEGVVFRNINACMNSTQDEPEQHAGHTCVMGVDYAKSGDFTVVSIGCKECEREVFIDRFNQIDYAFQNQRIESYWHDWSIHNGLGDSASIGEANLDYLHKAGVYLMGLPTNSYTQKASIIEGLSLALDKIAIQFIPDPVGKAELEAYEQSKTKTGLTSYGAPAGIHDDTVIARALMYRAMQQAPKIDRQAVQRVDQHYQALGAWFKQR